MKTLLKFSAIWCMPCKKLTPLLEKLLAENPDLELKEIDIEDEPSVATSYKIKSVPTLVLEVDGKETGRLIGLQNMAALKKFIDL